MDDYRCYFLGANGKFQWVREFHSADDASALLMAYQFFAAQREFSRFELWNGAHFVYASEEPCGVNAPMMQSERGIASGVGA